MDWVTDKNFLKTAIELEVIRPGDEVKIVGDPHEDPASTAREWDDAVLRILEQRRAVLLSAPASGARLEIGKEYTWPGDKAFLERILVGWRRP